MKSLLEIVEVKIACYVNKTKYTQKTVTHAQRNIRNAQKRLTGKDGTGRKVGKEKFHGKEKQGVL